MARIPKQRVIFDAEKYDLDYLRETRDSYSPMTDAEFEDSISYDMGEDDLRDLMETDWRSNENALDAFLGKSILVRYSPVNYDDGFVQFNLNDLHDLLHAHTSPLHRVDKVWDEDGHLFLSGKWPDNSPLLVEVRKLTVEGERAMDAILTADRRGDFDAVRGTFHAMWDDPALVSTPRYAELALGMPAEDALAPLPLDHITFDDEIAENGDKLNFYIPVTFNCDAVFGTDVCSLDNDDYLNGLISYYGYSSLDDLKYVNGDAWRNVLTGIIAERQEANRFEVPRLFSDHSSAVQFCTSRGIPADHLIPAMEKARAEYEKVKAAEAPEKAVSLKGEAQASRAASEKLAEGRVTGSPAREDPSIV